MLRKSPKFQFQYVCLLGWAAKYFCVETEVNKLFYMENVFLHSSFKLFLSSVCKLHLSVRWEKYC